jgi:hypothetical protein
MHPTKYCKPPLVKTKGGFFIARSSDGQTNPTTAKNSVRRHPANYHPQRMTTVFFGITIAVRRGQRRFFIVKSLKL